VERSECSNAHTVYVTTVISAQAVMMRGIVRGAALRMRRAKSISQGDNHVYSRCARQDTKTIS
jgi:hypothetical protein